MPPEQACTQGTLSVSSALLSPPGPSAATLELAQGTENTPNAWRAELAYP